MGGYEAGDTVEDARTDSNRYKVFFAAARTLLAEVDAQKRDDARTEFTIEMKMADNYLDAMNDLLDPAGPKNRMDQVRARSSDCNPIQKSPARRA